MIREAYTTRSLANKIRKRQANFLGHVMTREKLELLETTEMIEGKGIRGKQREKMLDQEHLCVGWTIKEAQSRTSDRCTESEEG